MNEQYKKLAHERAVLLALVRVARERYLPLEGMEDPEVKIESEDLPRSDSVVPEDTVIDVVMRIQRLANTLEKEMSNFTHVRAENSYEQEWKERPSQSSPTQSGAQSGKGKKQNRKGGK